MLNPQKNYALSANQRESILDLIRKQFEGEHTGHDVDHSIRVARNAVHLAQQEGGCHLALVEMAALLHDYADPKLCENPKEKTQQLTDELLQQGFSETWIQEMQNIIQQVSYKGAGVLTDASTIEARVVQDADRLDAIGAIGIARCFAYGASKGRPIYQEGQDPVLHKTEDAYRSHSGHSINHFYEKLLLLRDRMQTQSGKKAAAERHRFLEIYLEQFFNEWHGQDLQH